MRKWFWRLLLPAAILIAFGLLVLGCGPGGPSPSGCYWLQCKDGANIHFRICADWHRISGDELDYIQCGQPPLGSIASFNCANCSVSTGGSCGGGG